MVDKLELDAAIISVPITLHYPITTDILRTGVDIPVEKKPLQTALKSRTSEKSPHIIHRTGDGKLSENFKRRRGTCPGSNDESNPVLKRRTDNGNLGE